jgi:HemY protein
VRDRLKRVRRLADLRANHPEGAMAVARAAIDAHDWQAARTALGGPIRAEPSERVCLLMAEIEQGEHGDEGRVRSWLTRALGARRDPVWTADGHVFEAWAPVSPISARVDAFEWRVVAERLPLPRGFEIESKGSGAVARDAEPAQIGRPATAATAEGRAAKSTAPRGDQGSAARPTAPTKEPGVIQPSPDDPGPQALAEEENRLRVF